jgi:hypothetical protein
VFGDKGPAAFVEDDRPEALLALCALVNSEPFDVLVRVRLARTELAQSFEVGLIQQSPLPILTSDETAKLAALARHAWWLRRRFATVDETSQVFLLPTSLRSRLQEYDPSHIELELKEIADTVDRMASKIYGFGESDLHAAPTVLSTAGDDEEDETAIGAEQDEDDEESPELLDQTDGLLSWAVGVAVGRFDWRLATGEREAPPEPEPFDPLPAKSPGMLPEGAEPFHAHSGIVVNEQSHPHDLSRLVEEVLARVDTDVPDDVRHWLQHDFFPLHLKQYSKSRRKAPIYWPLSTVSGGYTLWIYYPSLTAQTLYTALNDFVEPKLENVGKEAEVLRAKDPARSREEDLRLEALQTLGGELVDLRNTLLQIAPTYRPNHDDGVQITAAPLWRLFRHAPWQKLLKDTWAKLEKGDYDWAHLAMAYWPDRVREKCKTDKSLAITHDLERLYVELEPKATKSRGRKKGVEA